MFTDMKLSKDMLAEFKSKPHKGTINNVEFSTEILTNGHWPEQNNIVCKLPLELAQCSSAFEAFYKNKH